MTLRLSGLSIGSIDEEREYYLSVSEALTQYLNAFWPPLLRFRLLGFSAGPAALPPPDATPPYVQNPSSPAPLLQTKYIVIIMEVKSGNAFQAATVSLDAMPRATEVIASQGPPMPATVDPSG